MGSQWILALDRLHPGPKHGQTDKRDLTGHVFGLDLPAWVIFHSMLGYAVIGCGLVALILRLPFKPIAARRWLHPYFGWTFVFGTVWMPITAIWAAYGPIGWDVVSFFIYSMYAAIQAGWICIRLWLSKTRHDRDLPTSDPPSRKTSARTGKLLKIAHGCLMGYSFIMLLGAGVSFPLRGQVNTNYANQSAPHSS